MDDVILYHGSRNGIDGEIVSNHPDMRRNSDFGIGFYMGTNEVQARTLITGGKRPTLYTVKFNLSSIPENRIAVLDGMDWAYFVLYNRGKLGKISPSIVETDFYRRYAGMSDGKDVIVGPIADDRMYIAMENFSQRLINDTTLLEAMKRMKLGIQYVAKTKFACRCIKILNKHNMYGAELQHYNDVAKGNRKKAFNAYQEVIDMHLTGKYLNEILTQR